MDALKVVKYSKQIFMKILAKTFRFDKGQLQVILLPENFNEKLYSGDQWKENQAWHQWKDDIAYARAHPIDVHPDSVQKIKRLIWDKYGLNLSFWIILLVQLRPHRI